MAPSMTALLVFPAGVPILRMILLAVQGLRARGTPQDGGRLQWRGLEAHRRVAGTARALAPGVPGQPMPTADVALPGTMVEHRTRR